MLRQGFKSKPPVKRKPKNRYDATTDIDYDGKKNKYKSTDKKKLGAYFVQPPHFEVKPILTGKTKEV